MNKEATAKKLMIFTDFDGTISRTDLGDAIFMELGQFEPNHSKFISGEMTITEYWTSASSTLREGTGEDEIVRFAEAKEIDAYFARFVEYCREQEIPLSVISDGFDTYINAFLLKHGIEGLPRLCNYFDFTAGAPKPVFPYKTDSCECGSAVCKRNAIIAKTDPDAVIVFIGDGYSDFCAATHSDIVFAKNGLAAFCNANKIPHYPYSTFFDVLRILKKIVETGKIKTRNSALLLRKKAFETE